MAELPPFWPPSETDFPHTISRPPGPQAPLWSCVAGTSDKILGFLGPRDCTGDGTGIWCFCAAGRTQPSCQFMQLGQPSGCRRCASASTRPRPPPTTSSGGSTYRAPQLVQCRAGWHTQNQHSVYSIYIDVECYVPMCIYESI